MDYKYIEQLLERYWQCETNLEEEQILKLFFSQENVPAHLQQYKKLFADIKSLQGQTLSEDFDRKVLDRIQADLPVKAKKVTLSQRLKPFYKAAAVVAIAVTLGNAAQSSFKEQREEDYNYDSYQDTYTDPAVAYDKVSDALDMVSKSLGETARRDSLLKSTQRN